ncbi:MAG: hypothetical protein J2P37_01200 [Ktedonobacteraceae bacterium]|nr:hypothetical protein [Ktedonobacteraceae bacterium]MBO0795570.1 hypothetical protein [Ktedonobacteraceae bacterium]
MQEKPDMPDTLKQEFNNEFYLKVWQIEQDFVRTRWTVVTFFMSISLAITGLSFQQNFAFPKTLVIRIAGLLIYWFAYLLHIHFHDYSKKLRDYLVEMEQTKRTTLDIQSKTGRPLNPTSGPSTTQSLFLFGLIYILSILLLLFLQI